MDKQAAISLVESEFGKLLAAIDGLDERAMSRVFYGDWSVKDILAHISGWQHTMAGALERMARGERPTPEGVDYSDADAWNAKFAAAMRPQNAATVVADLRQSFANFVRAAKALPAERFGEGKTANKLLEANGYGHYREHLAAIEEYRKTAAPERAAG
ncbi:MAG TPA: maleylpyruvate isomerase N-terminal domain-containing protein [Dehalococcoidia bacterium]|nr:maleylpyruvate isomerase N-terminal domain-containing protein [Dehalococcoidia bacterium]